MRDLRWNKNENKLIKLCEEYGIDRNTIYTKEKYGRYDLTVGGFMVTKGDIIEFMDKCWEMENDSLDMCQTCGIKSKQFRDYGGWYTHHCLYHYIVLILKKYIRKTILTFKIKKWLT